MTALIVIGILLLFFVFLFSLRAKLTIAYDGDFGMSVQVLCFRFRILPKREKKGPHSMSRSKAQKIRKKLEKKADKKRAKKAEKQKKKQHEKEHPTEKPKKSLSEILDLISLCRKLAAKVIRKFFGHLRIDVARLHLTVATGDAATTAIAYGAVTESVALLYPVLESVKTFRVPDMADVDIRADFCADSMDADILISFSLRVWHVFDIAFGALFTFIRHKVSGLIKKNANAPHPPPKPPADVKKSPAAAKKP